MEFSCGETWLYPVGTETGLDRQSTSFYLFKHLLLWLCAGINK